MNNLYRKANETPSTISNMCLSYFILCHSNPGLDMNFPETRLFQLTKQNVIVAYDFSCIRANITYSNYTKHVNIKRCLQFLNYD